MSRQYLRIVLALCVIVAAGSARAQNPTFAELLARAQAQAEAGHRWAPAGDNMTETVVSMMDLIPTATPQQLAELSALLENDRAGQPPRAPGVEASLEGRRGSGAGAGAPSRSGDVLSIPPLPDTAAPLSPRAAPAARPVPPVEDTATPPPKRPETVPATLTPTAPSPVPPAAALSPTAPSPAAPSPAAPSSAAPSSGPLAAPPPAPSVAPPPAPLAAPSAALSPPPAARPITTSPAELVPPPVEGIAPRPAQTRRPQTVARPGPRAVDLFARGQQAELQGDVSGARRFYASAAQQGHATAARDLGRLYDPAYLKQTALGGIDPDPVMARQWYERAIAMGDAEAGPLLEALSLR